MMHVLDTHTLIWWTTMPERLGPGASDALGEAQILGVPSICLWETALLVRKEKLELDLRVGDWARDLLSIPRVRELPLDAMTAIAADGLEMHPDPADRFIVATALRHDAPLITKDGRLHRLPFVETLW